MNERIRELARQSGGIDMTNHVAGGTTTWIGTGTPEFLEQFAELIVQECVNVLHDNELWNSHISHALKEHFGVDQ